jgi:VanZ family protein
MQLPYFCSKFYILKQRFVYFIPAILCFLLSFYLLTLPGKELPQISWIGKFQIDKLIHICMFFSVCLLFCYPFRQFHKRYSIILLIAIASLCYGIVMEFVQKYFIPNRSLEIADMVADGTGSFLAYWVVYKRFKKEELVAV